MLEVVLSHMFNISL